MAQDAKDYGCRTKIRTWEIETQTAATCYEKPSLHGKQGRF